MLVMLLLLISLLITVESLKVQSSLSLYRSRHRLNTRRYYQQIDNENTNNIISSNITNTSTTTTDITTITNTTNTTNTDDNNMINSYLLLNLVAIIYGTQHPIIKISMSDFSSTSLVNFWRFFSSALLFSPAFIQMFFNDIKKNEMIDSNNDDNNNNKYDIYKAGIELGLYTFLGFAFQAIGLETTTASRSAFLLYLNVKFVPFLALILFKRPIHPLSWLSATLALIGTSLLSTDGGSLNVGDVWCICAAIGN